MSLQAWRVPGAVGLSLTSPAERDAWASEWARNGGVTLEIGTFHGVSAFDMAQRQPSGRVISIDPFVDNGELGEGFYRKNRRENMTLFMGTLVQMVLRTGFPYDVRTAWVDGGHTYEGAKLDLVQVTTQMDGGSILVHDYTAMCYAETVKKAADEVMGKTGWTLHRIVETTAVYRKEA